MEWFMIYSFILVNLFCGYWLFWLFWLKKHSNNRELIENLQVFFIVEGALIGTLWFGCFVIWGFISLINSECFFVVCTP